jgi:excisionase family DNA binding protein
MTARLLTAADVAERLNVPTTWVREATRDGRLPHLRLGRYVRYDDAAITAWLAAQRRQSAR